MRSPDKWNRWRILLWPIALFYGALVWWRNFFYHIGFFVSRRIAVPVVSVGNLSVGGTGKTPAVIFLAKSFLEQGRRVGIVSRGYGRLSSGTVVVSDGVDILASTEDSGDEPMLMARRLPAVPVVVDEDRYRGAQVLVEQFSPDLVLMDDGFQHRGLARDCDLVLMDATAAQKDYRMLPYGMLRERLSALRRSRLIIWTRTDLQAPPAKIKSKVDSLGIAQVDSVMTIGPELQRVGTEELVQAANLHGRDIVAFCGIARPHTFYQSLISMNLEPAWTRYFSDHHWYSDSTLNDLANLVSAGGIFITTEKDAVKLPADFTGRHEIYTLRVEMSLDQKALERLQSILSASTSSLLKASGPADA